MEPETNGNDDETIVDTTRPRQVVPSGPNLKNYRSDAARLESFWKWTHRYPLLSLGLPLPTGLSSIGCVETGT